MSDRRLFGTMSGQELQDMITACHEAVVTTTNHFKIGSLSHAGAFNVYLAIEVAILREHEKAARLRSRWPGVPAND